MSSKQLHHIAIAVDYAMLSSHGNGILVVILEGVLCLMAGSTGALPHAHCKAKWDIISITLIMAGTMDQCMGHN